MKKRIFSLFTSLIMVISLVVVLPITVEAQEISNIQLTCEYKVLDDGTVEITKCIDDGSQNGTYFVPSTLDEKKVTKIGEKAFEKCFSIRNVVIPGSIETIGKNAFFDCWGLNTVIIQNGVKTIESGAFSCCEFLHTVTIPDSVETIGSSAFYNCSELGRITIPDSVTSLGDSMFMWCVSLYSVTLPKNTKCVGKSFFSRCSNLKTIDLPEGITEIGDFAFYGCYNLTEIKIPDSVTTIGDYAYYHCQEVKTVTIPKSVTSIGDSAFGYYNYNINNVHERLLNFLIRCYQGTAGEQYARDNGFKFVPVDGGYITKGDYEYQILSNGTAEIVRYNGNETDVEIPSYIDCRRVTSIGSKISDTSDNIDGSIKPDNVVAAFDGNVKSVVIPDTVSTIKEFAFYWCTELSSIKLPAWLSSIDSYGIYGCPSLKSIELPSKLQTLKSFAISNCENLKNVKIPKYINKVEDYALGFAVSGCLPTKRKIEGFSLNCFEGTEGERYAISNDISYTYLNSNKPVVVTGIKASTVNQSTIKLTWDKVAGAKGYIIYNYNASTKKWERIEKTTTTDNAYLVRKLKAGTTYKFTVKAYKTVNGQELTNTKYRTITASTCPAVVTGFKTAATSAQAIKLTWNKVSGATGYVVYRASAGKWVRVGVVKTNSFYEGKLKSGTSYRYAVKAYKTFGGKNYYSPSYPTLWTSTNPATVKFTLTSGSKKAVVKWSKVTGATGYKVYYKTSANGKWVGLKTTNNSTTSYTKTGLTKGKTYYFTVKAYRTVNGKTYNGTFVTKSVKVK